MDHLLIWMQVATFITAISHIGCRPDGEGRIIPKCRDASDMVDCLHNYLPEDMNLEEKCKWYAVVWVIISGKGRPHFKRLTDALKLDPDEVNRLYQDIDRNDLGGLFMNAIDGYRISVLRPPFLELVECLRMIDTPVVDRYLKSDELKLIIDLYKQVVQSPDVKIELDLHALSNFHPAFRTSLKNLFSKYSSDSEMTSGSVDRQKTTVQSRHRERERLRQQRLRLLHPEVQRTKERLKAKRKRDRDKEERHLLKRLKQDQQKQNHRREIRNLRQRQQRLRKKLLLQQQQQQELLGHTESEPQPLPDHLIEIPSTPACEEIPSPQPRGRHLFDPPCLSVEQLQALEARSDQQLQQPLVEPMAPFPRFSRDLGYRASVPQPPCALPPISPVGTPLQLDADSIEHRFQTYDVLDEHNRPLNSSLSTLGGSHPFSLRPIRVTIQFDDTESVMRSFLDTTDLEANDPNVTGESPSRASGRQRSGEDNQ